MTDEKKPHDPGIDFYTFCLSLGSSAFVHLGDARNPEGDTPPNLPLARQTIDILGMLQEKTKGNLTPEEDKFLDALLVNLRLRYVAKSSGRG